MLWCGGPSRISARVPLTSDKSPSEASRDLTDTAVIRRKRPSCCYSRVRVFCLCGHPSSHPPSNLGL
uniref:Uncharacterized protein n=1 Tax=Arundo donax TaxID=35708 RepID=A0A0A8Z7A0_ARUDO